MVQCNLACASICCTIMTMNPTLTVTPATLEDAAAIAEIYAPYVLESSASFETEPPDESDTKVWMSELMMAGFPWLVVREETDGGNSTVVGFGYGQHFRARNGYAFSCETSIYVRQESLGKGIGTALISALVDECERLGFRQAFAVIAGTEPAAVVLHARAGYFPVGTLNAAGWKHGKWVDVFIMQRKLGEGHDTLPQEMPARPMIRPTIQTVAQNVRKTVET